MNLANLPLWKLFLAMAPRFDDADADADADDDDAADDDDDYKWCVLLH